MNSSPDITVVSNDTHAQNKKTVPEMFLLHDMIVQAVARGSDLRQVLRGCTPEERAILFGVFEKVHIAPAKRR